MLMHSVHEQCPNSDPKTVHYHKTGLGAQCAHPEPRSRAHCARSAQVVGAAARTADRLPACRAHSQRMSCACWACAGRDTPRQPTPGRYLTSMSRHQGSHNHAATSNRCRDTTQSTPGRDFLFRSRPPGD